MSNGKFKINPSEKELDAIKDLEKVIGRKIPRLLISSGIKGWEVGYIVENGMITKLGLASTNIADLPNSFGDLNSLEILWLSGNKISHFPESFQKLINLKILYIRNNEISYLPDWFYKLKSLQVLYLSHNKVKSIPESFGKLQNLKKLYLMNNQLITLPESFGDLKNLEELSLSSNNIRYLPTSIGKLKKLWKLDLNFNQLSNLPEKFANLGAIKELDISRNKLKCIPGPLWGLTNLQKFEIHGNELIGKSTEMLKEPLDKIRDFCRKISRIHIMLIYDEKDKKHFRIPEIANFLEKEPEIYDVSYIGSNKWKDIDDLLDNNLDKIHIVIFFASNNSILDTSSCKYELGKVMDAHISILQVADINFDLSGTSITEMQNILSVRYLKYDFTGFLKNLYDFIREYKREVNVFNKYIAKFERNKLLIKKYFLEIINSQDFQKYYYANFSEISNFLEKMSEGAKEKAFILTKLFKSFGE